MANIPYPNNFDDDFMNIFKEVITMMNKMGYTYEESLQKAHDILDEAQQTNDMNTSVQQQINTLIAESGTSDAEVLQARTDSQGVTHEVLNERLNKSEHEIEGNKGEIGNINTQKLVSVIRKFPTSEDPYNIVYAENNGMTLYAFAGERHFMKSVDGGFNWEKKGQVNMSINTRKGFLKTKTGTLLFVDNLTRIARSEDDGDTWEIVHTFRTNTNLLNSQAWCVDGDNNIYYGEYETSDASEIHIYKSTDDGRTFEVFKNFAGPGSANEFIRHIHTVQYDEISDRVYFCIGDNNYHAGIWRTTADGNDIEPVLLSADEYRGEQYGRAVGICFFPDYLVWGLDTSHRPHIVRIRRSDIGKNGGVFEPEYVYRNANSSFLGVVKANSAGTKWIASASQEGSSIDNSVHLYLIEEQGDKIREVGSIPFLESNSIPHITQVGEVTDKEEFWFTTQGILQHSTVQASLAQTNYPIIDDQRTLNLKPAAQNSGVIVVPSGESQDFGFVRSGSVGYRTLYITDAGIRRDSNYAGYADVEIYNQTKDEVLYSFRNTSLRTHASTYGLPYTLKFVLGSRETIIFRIKEWNGADFKGMAYVEYSWG